MEPGTDLRKVLSLGGSRKRLQGILEMLRGTCDIHEVGDLPSAVSAMRDGMYDAILSEVGDFLPLERAMASQLSAVVLDTLGEGVCVVSERGETVWANRRLREFPADLREKIRRVCEEAYESFALRRPLDQERTRRFSIVPGDGKYYEVICSPVLDPNGILRQVAGVIIDATRQRRIQQTLNAIERAGQELVRLDTESLKPKDVPGRLKLLEERLIHCSREVLQFEHFAVLLLDPKSNRLDWLTGMGLDAEIKERGFFATTSGNGICGYVAATGHSYICVDTEKDPHYIRGFGGARSSLTVPLRLWGRVIGVLNAEATRPGAFGEEERQFAEMFAHYVAMAMHVLELLVNERYSASTEVSGSLRQEAAGPLSDIITEAGELMEDYIGHDDLRHRLQSIIDRATNVRRHLQKVSDQRRRGVLDMPQSNQAAAKDPVLGGKRILVADDEELIRRIVGDVLKPCGCQVDLAADGTEAIALLGKNDYDLIVTDIKMPGATGYDVFAASRKNNPDRPVIMITGFGYDPGHTIIRANQEGLSAVLYKPFKVDALIEQCRNAIQKRK